MVRTIETTSDPKFEVIMQIVFLKSTLRPCESVKKPSSNTCRRMFHTKRATRWGEVGRGGARWGEGVRGGARRGEVGRGRARWGEVESIPILSTHHHDAPSQTRRTAQFDMAYAAPPQ